MIKLNHQLPESFFAEEAKTLIVSAETKRIWAVLLDLLLEFDGVCKRNGIRYFIDSGTLLGAVRHRGFIPWDDDLDVALLREEYEKLCAVAPKEFRHPYFFQTNATDSGSARGHAQLRNSLTTGILKSEMKDGKSIFQFNQGMFLDIFPLDDVPDNQEELRLFRNDILLAKRKVSYTRSCVADNGMSGIRQFARRIKAEMLITPLRFKRNFFGKDMLTLACENFDYTLRKYCGLGMLKCANMVLYPFAERKMFDRSVYNETAEYEFEGFRFPGPADYETVLRGYYGDWRRHVVGGSVHGGVFFDTDRPYTEYLK